MKTHTLIDGGTLFFNANTDTPLTVFIVGRDSFFKDIELIHCLERKFSEHDFSIIRYEDVRKTVRSFLYANGRFEHLPLITRRINKGFMLCAAPNMWIPFMLVATGYAQYMSFREWSVRHALHYLGSKKHFIILGRSAGARIGTRIADSEHLMGVVCIGYPFKHPNHGNEPERYRHLARLKTPTLIVQGTQDEYGGTGIEDVYVLSDSITLHWADTGHDFNLPSKELQRVGEDIVVWMKKTAGISL